MINDLIHLLPEHVANQIAAGEVIQRPSSIVKELLENAIDAGATEIKLIIKEGGRSLVQVIDNGIGMTFNDAKMCFQRYATSKIEKAEDIFNIYTKGFRGEALAAIAAVAHVELKTNKMQEADVQEEWGTLLTIEGGNISAHQPYPCSLGTSIAVKNLFFNIPARRNFLKNNVVENRNILLEFERIALTHPEISFYYYNNEALLYSLQGTSLKQRVIRFLGKNYEEKLCHLEVEQVESIKISGFIGKPEYAKKLRGEQYFFVNNRFFKHLYFHHAVVEAFGNLLKEGTYPTYLIYLDIDPKKIDINIHPAKIEIKFQDEQMIYTLIYSAIRRFLGKYNFTDAIDFNLKREDQIPYLKPSNRIDEPKIDIDAAYNPCEIDRTTDEESFHSANTKKVYYQDQRNIQSYRKKSAMSEEEKQNWADIQAINYQNGAHIQVQEISEISADLAAETWVEQAKNNQNNLFSTYFKEEKKIEYFLIKQKYITALYEEEILIIDQIRAHHRIEFEKIITAWACKKVLTQTLLFPIKIAMNAREFEHFKWMEKEFEELGFEISILSHEVIGIHGAPAAFIHLDLTELIIDLLNNKNLNKSIEKLNKNQIIAKILSQHLAHKKAQKLEPLAVENIILNLFNCEDPKFCPDGKVIFFKINQKEIEKKLN